MNPWIQAARLRTLPLAIANVTMGAVLAYHHGWFSWIIYSLTVLTAVLLQVLSNFANEYGDFIHGADHTERQGPQRTVQSGAISAPQMKKAMVFIGALCILSGCTLVFLTHLYLVLKLFFIALGCIAVWAAINYTAGDKPYGYRGLGDLSVFMFFGLLSVIGSYFLQTGIWNWSIILPAISCGAFSMAVLNINNIRDIESDRIAGKNSLALKMGRPVAVNYHALLLFIGLVAALSFTLIDYSHWVQLIFLLVVPLLTINYRAVKSKLQPMELDPYLKQMALTTLLFVITFSIGLIWS